MPGGGIIKIERLYFRVKNMSEEEKKVPLEDGDMKEVKEGEEQQKKIQQRFLQYLRRM